MNPIPLLEGWTWNPIAMLACVGLVLVYALRFRAAVRWSFFIAALALLVIALMSPLNTIASGVLFSAHMTQHILLLLIIPALLLLSLPPKPSRRSGSPATDEAHSRWRPSAAFHFGKTSVAAFGWAGGIGSMWIWHAPALCDAAVSNSLVHAIQIVSLLGLGAAFWWPILASRTEDRIAPAAAVAYLATACLACTALGIILTLAPVEVCSVFRSPVSATNNLGQLRQWLSPEHDRQIGGLLMWIPMCLVYLSAILFELARWLSAPAERPETQL